MVMSREEMDRFDREINGIYAPPVSYRPQPSPPMADVEGRPITASYSLDDIRRFLGFGRPPATPGAMPANVEAMLPPEPAAPPAFIPPPAPPAPPPRPAAPARPRLPVMQGVPSEADMQFQPARPDTFGGLSPEDMAAMGQSAPAMPQPAPAAPAAAAAPGRRAAVPVTRQPSPQDLARALAEQAERDRLIARGWGIRVP